MTYTRWVPVDKHPPKNPSAVFSGSDALICQAIEVILAYGCNLGPETMAHLTTGVSYSQIKRIADWPLHEAVLWPALADIVNAVGSLSTASVWGNAQTASSAGQRFLFPRKTTRCKGRLCPRILQLYRGQLRPLLLRANRVLRTRRCLHPRWTALPRNGSRD